MLQAVAESGAELGRDGLLLALELAEFATVKMPDLVAEGIRSEHPDVHAAAVKLLFTAEGAEMAMTDQELMAALLANADDARLLEAMAVWSRQLMCGPSPLHEKACFEAPLTAAAAKGVLGQAAGALLDSVENWPARTTAKVLASILQPCVQHGADLSELFIGKGLAVGFVFDPDTTGDPAAMTTLAGLLAGAAPGWVLNALDSEPSTEDALALMLMIHTDLAARM